MRAAIGIDPGDRTGIAICTASAPHALVRAELASIRSARWSEARAVALLNELVGDAEWMAAVEQPWGHLRGRQHARTAPPAYAERHWRNVLVLLARYRAQAAGLKYRPPIILRPRPGEWRHALGIATVGIGPSDVERTAYLKRCAIAWLREVYGVAIDQPDVAEGACIAVWAARASSAPMVVKSGKLERTRWAA